MQFLTDFGDQAVTLPLAACAGLALALCGWRRGALAWAVAAGLCWAAMLALKLGFEACGPAPAPGVLANPSGHTASATFVYAGLAALVAGRRSGLAAAAATAVVIGASRVVLGVHSLPDVVTGGIVGMASVWALDALAGPRPTRVSIGWPAAALVAAPLLLHGTHLSAEERLHRLAFGRDVWPLSLCVQAGPLAARP